MNLALKLAFKNLYYFIKNKETRTFYKIAALIGEKKRYEPGYISFSNYKMKYSDPLSFVWQYSEIFKEKYYLFTTTNQNPLIYDCGSNIGTSCLFFKENYSDSTIKAFEADPNIAKVLEENINYNKLKNVEIINAAVWIDNNGIELTTDGADGASVYSVNANTVKVKSVRLKDILDAETQQIDFLKMDIEGAEKQVIIDCGGSLKKINNLFIEYHDFENITQDLDKILNTLSQNGFQYHILNAHSGANPFSVFEKKKNLQLNIFAKQIK